MFPGGEQDAVAPAVGVLLVAVVLTALVAAFVVKRRRMRKFGFLCIKLPERIEKRSGCQNSCVGQRCHTVSAS